MWPSTDYIFTRFLLCVFFPAPKIFLGIEAIDRIGQGGMLPVLTDIHSRESSPVRDLEHGRRPHHPVLPRHDSVWENGDVLDEVGNSLQWRLRVRKLFKFMEMLIQHNLEVLNISYHYEAACVRNIHFWSLLIGFIGIIVTDIVCTRYMWIPLVILLTLNTWQIVRVTPPR